MSKAYADLLNDEARDAVLRDLCECTPDDYRYTAAASRAADMLAEVKSLQTAIAAALGAPGNQSFGYMLGVIAARSKRS